MMPQARRLDGMRGLAFVAGGLIVLTAVAGRAVADEFPPARNTQAETVPFTPPQEALAKLRMPAGFRATLFAAEPEVQQPIAMSFDTRGRMWVAENYTYAEQPLRFDRTQRDRLIVLEDTNHDGHADRRTVFYDQFQGLTSVETGFGGVWALAPPNLYFIPDADGDLVPDSDPVVVLDGFEVGPSNTHNFANGLKWGPDGWLYGRVGITAPGKIGLPGTAPEKRVDVGPSLWRYHPITRAVEEVCTGTTNPWGHDWDEHGELFFINTVIGHLWYAMPGAHYRRMFGADRNPYVYQLIEQTADHFHWDTTEAWNEAKKGVSQSTDQAGGGHAHCGMMIYQGDNWPAEYRGKLFTLNMHGYRVNVDRLERAGATYVGKHEPDMIFSDDPWFRGTEISYGPDGSVYILDWSDIGECHENDGVHRTSGRIFKITYGDVKPPAIADVAALGSLELVDLLNHPNEWYSRQARRVLQERAANGDDVTAAVAELQQRVTSDRSVAVRLRALWGLHAVGGAQRELLTALLADPDEHLRTWAVRLLTDRNGFAYSDRNTFTALAQRETSGLVLTALASALQTTRLSQAIWPIAKAIASREEFAEDPVLPLMIWYGVERGVVPMPEPALDFALAAKSPLLRQFVARRLGQDWKRLTGRNANALPAALRLASDAQRRDLLAGLNEGLRGWQKVEPPPGWDQLQAAFTSGSDPEIARMTREISVVFGDGRAMDQLRDLVLSSKTDISTRRSALRSLVDARAENLMPVLKKLVTDRDISDEVVRGLARSGDAETGPLLVSHFNRFDPGTRDVAIQTLVSRPEFGLALTTAIDKQQIARDFVPIFAVRQLQSYDHAELSALVQKLWPELRPITADKKLRIEEFKQRLNSGALSKADPLAGRQLWEKSCAKCHQLFGEGGKIGPDLTGAQRHNLDYVLENVIDPSAALQPQFRMTTIELSDGRVINGVVLAKTEQTWEVQTPTDKVTLRVADIEDSALSAQSLMPEGLLDLLTPNEVANLVAYVMSPRQVPLKAPAGGE